MAAEVTILHLANILITNRPRIGAFAVRFIIAELSFAYVTIRQGQFTSALANTLKEIAFIVFLILVQVDTKSVALIFQPVTLVVST